MKSKKIDGKKTKWWLVGSHLLSVRFHLMGTSREQRALAQKRAKESREKNAPVIQQRIENDDGLVDGKKLSYVLAEQQEGINKAYGRASTAWGETRKMRGELDELREHVRMLPHAPYDPGMRLITNGELGREPVSQRSPHPRQLQGRQSLQGNLNMQPRVFTSPVGTHLQAQLERILTKYPAFQEDGQPVPPRTKKHVQELVTNDCLPLTDLQLQEKLAEFCEPMLTWKRGDGTTPYFTEGSNVYMLLSK